MSEISKEALAAACEEKVKQLEFSVKQSAFDSVRQELETELQIARVALAALRERAEPVVYMNRFTGRAFELEQQPGADKDPDVYIPLYAAPPAPVVPKIDRKAICNKAHWQCARSPGATFYNAAEFALDEVMDLLAPPAPGKEG
ncbi:hypothetical protein SMY61_003235 [Cronobacter sakazakii]|nr:hypothetical protein [Cronobacter sakazakii]ELY4364599.1 hypothetical protein [Cronobacter sakazakii]